MVVISLLSQGWISLIENKGSIVDDIPHGTSYIQTYCFEKLYGRRATIEVTIIQKERRRFNLNNLEKIEDFKKQKNFLKYQNFLL